jgi:hypothetical protein
MSQEGSGGTAEYWPRSAYMLAQRGYYGEVPTWRELVCGECGDTIVREETPSERDGASWPEATKHWDAVARQAHRGRCPGKRALLYRRALGQVS